MIDAWKQLHSKRKYAIIIISYVLSYGGYPPESQMGCSFHVQNEKAVIFFCDSLTNPLFYVKETDYDQPRNKTAKTAYPYQFKAQMVWFETQRGMAVPGFDLAVYETVVYRDL